MVSFFPIYSQTVHFFNVFLLFKVVYLLILHIVKAGFTAYYSVSSTTESTFSYFPTYSQRDHLIKYFLKYKVVCLLILHTIRAWRTECHSVFSTTECHSVFSTTECIIRYFPFHSRTAHLLNFCIVYQAVFLLILHIVRAGRTYCY